MGRSRRGADVGEQSEGSGARLMGGEEGAARGLRGAADGAAQHGTEEWRWRDAGKKEGCGECERKQRESGWNRGGRCNTMLMVLEQVSNTNSENIQISDNGGTQYQF